MKKTILTLAVFFIVSMLLNDLFAQCPMCRMTLESNLEAGGTAGNKINMGILYMLVVPYILIFSIGFMWYKRNRKPDDFKRDIQRTIPQA